MPRTMTVRHRIWDGRKVVPRDRIELSTPGFSAARTDVRRCPQTSIIVFTLDLKSRVTSGVAHQHPGTKVSAKVSFAMGLQPPELIFGGLLGVAAGTIIFSPGICTLALALLLGSGSWPTG